MANSQVAPPLRPLEVSTGAGAAHTASTIESNCSYGDRVKVTSLKTVEKE